MEARTSTRSLMARTRLTLRSLRARSSARTHLLIPAQYFSQSPTRIAHSNYTTTRTTYSMRTSSLSARCYYSSRLCRREGPLPARALASSLHTTAPLLLRYLHGALNTSLQCKQPSHGLSLRVGDSLHLSRLLHMLFHTQLDHSVPLDPRV